jgi:DNA-binding transcriptional ArsR family regulator
MKKDSVEVSSDQLKAELIAIKERLGALETIASISNRQVVEVYVREHLKTDKGKQILKECEEPRTRDYLMKKFGFNSAPALDYHLTPLREADLIRQRFDDDGTTQTFEQSNLFKRLPKSSVKKLLDGHKEEKTKTALPGKASAKD